MNVYECIYIYIFPLKIFYFFLNLEAKLRIQENKNQACDIKLVFGNLSSVMVKQSGDHVVSNCSIRDSVWEGIHKTNNTFFVKANLSNNMIQPWKCRDQNDTNLTWDYTHSYREDDTFFFAILLENIDVSDGKNTYKVICQKTHSKSKKLLLYNKQYITIGCFFIRSCIYFWIVYLYNQHMYKNHAVLNL